MITLRTIFAVALLSVPACYADTVAMLFTNLPDTIENGAENGVSADVAGISHESLLCDDYNDETSAPLSNLIYDFSMLTSSNPSQNAMFAASTAAANFDEAELPVYQGTEPSSSASADAAAAYPCALCNLMTSTAPLLDSQVRALQADALPLEE